MPPKKGKKGKKDDGFNSDEEASVVSVTEVEGKVGKKGKGMQEDETGAALSLFMSSKQLLIL